jgi:hypothetical protein
MAFKESMGKRRTEMDGRKYSQHAPAGHHAAPTANVES